MQKLYSFCCKIHIFTLPHLSYKVSLHREQHNTHITTYHYPLSITHLFPHSIILKLHHLAQKHISISFFISHTKSPFSESNITNVIIQKTILVAAFTTFNLHLSISYFHSFYKTHSSQNTPTYLSYIFKFQISQSIYIYI